MSDFILADGFGNLSDGTHTAGSDREILGDQWSQFGYNFSIEDRSDGRKWLKNNGSQSIINLYTGTLGGLTTVQLCFRVIRATGAHVKVASLYDGSDNIGGIHINATGQLVYSTYIAGDAPQAGIVATGPTIPLNTETFVEVVVALAGGTGGSVAFYVNGAHSSTTSSIDTINYGTSVTAIRFFYHSSNYFGIPNGWKFSDIVLHSGSSPVGDLGVFYVESDTAGTDSDFTPSAGDNENNVDEIGPDEDTTYNESDGTAGHRDSFTGDGISNVDVLSVGTLVRARKTSTGAASLLVGALHSGSEDQSAAKALSEDYLTLLEYFDDCPSTSSAWTTAQVGAAEASYEVD